MILLFFTLYFSQNPIRTYREAIFITNLKHYEYRYSGEINDSKNKARDVHKAVQGLELPYFRLKHLDMQLDQSTTAIYYHLQELERRGYVLKVGTQYVDTQAMEDWNLWQLKRLIERLKEEGKKAKQVAERYSELKELKKEQLQELKELKSNRWKKQQVDQLRDLEDAMQYQEQKREKMENNADMVLRLVIKLQNDSSSNCEKSYSPDIRSMLERQPIKA